MFRIRVIRDDQSLANAEALQQLNDTMRKQFPLADEKEIAQVTARLRQPIHEIFWPLLIVAEDINSKLLGFASVLLYQPLQLAQLEFISTAANRSGGGVGAMLYERTREECVNLGCIGLLFECLQDEPERVSDKTVLQQNIQRMRFYERFDVRPIVNSQYEGLDKNGHWGPFIMLDQLGVERAFSEYRLNLYVPLYVKYKYPESSTPDELLALARAFESDQLALRPLRYSKAKAAPGAGLRPGNNPAKPPFAIVINDKHEIHHVRDRGYVQAPVRVPKILEELKKTKLFREVAPVKTDDRHIFAVHDKKYVEYLKRVCKTLPEKQSIYPAVFPLRNFARPPKDMAMQAGYYCMDTFTPLNRNAYLAARAAVDCTLTAANEVLDGGQCAYALVRPPGHHAERKAFGGFCYFNSSAVAAHYMSKYGRVAVLDVDYHHGNGTENIFYDRSDVFTLSIHGDPAHAYPYFSGFADEVGAGAGHGYNLNFPLPEKITPDRYRLTLKKAMDKIRGYKPEYLILALGLDTAKADPTGTWELRADDFFENGKIIAGLNVPLLVVQEGGYRTRTLGINAKAFFQGLWAEMATRKA